MAGISQWRAAMSAFKAGTGKATAVVIGDSITEGFYAGANARAADMCVTRAGLKLAARGGKTWASRYMPTGAIDCDPTAAFGPWPESADPWTRSGSVQAAANQEGLGLRATQMITSAGYEEIAAPSWATHATIQFTATNSASMPIEVRSNGVLVHAETIADTNEHSVIVPLQGSGNLLRITVLDASLSYLRLYGVVWQKDAHPAGMILAGPTAAGNASFGGTTTVSLTGMATGDLMVCVVGMNNGGTPAAPAGWTSRATFNGTSAKYMVCTRVKQAGDTTVAFAPGGLANTDVTIASFKGATWGSISAAVSNTAAGTSIDPPAASLTMGDGSLVVVGSGNGVVGEPYVYPANWSAAAHSSQNLAVGVAKRLFGIDSDQSVDPGAVTFATAPDRVAWQIDLVRTNNDRSALCFVEVLDGGHGGYQAHTYANPVASGGLPPVSYDTAFKMFQSIAQLKPDLIVVFLGLNDITNGRSPSDFQTSLETIVTQADAHMTTPDILFVTYPYIDVTLAGLTYYSPAQWAAMEAAATAVAAAHSTRAAHLKLSDFLGPLDGTTTDGFTYTDHFHPTAQGHNQIGDVIGAYLAGPVEIAMPVADAGTGSVASTPAAAARPPASSAVAEAVASGERAAVHMSAASAGADAVPPAFGGAKLISMNPATAIADAPAPLVDATILEGLDWEDNPFTESLDALPKLEGYIRADGARVFSSNQSMNDHRLTELREGLADHDAATVAQLNLFVGRNNPGMTRPGVWVELRDDGSVRTIWVESGV